MQRSLFDHPDSISADSSGVGRPAIEPVMPDSSLIKLAQVLPPNVRFGTSSWHYPGWQGLVWRGQHAQAELSRHGLPCYAKHPLFRTVSVDRGFYRALDVAQYARYAAQVPQDFRFIVKAPSLVTDALVRDESGRGMRANSGFLDPALAMEYFVQPAVEGLGDKLGALVFQISPLPGKWLNNMPALIQRLHHMLCALPELRSLTPDGVVAVEVRDPQWLSRDFVEALRRTGATYCLGLHAKMPPLVDQLPILRALWPGPMVCRWNLNPVHGAYGYEQARDLYSPFNQLIDPDPHTRNLLARVIQGTAAGGQNVLVTLSNKAEGSAPLSVVELAREAFGRTVTGD